MAELTPEQKKIVEERRARLTPLYPQEMDETSDEEILSWSEAVYQAMLNKPVSPPATQEEVKALYGAIEKQNDLLRQLNQRLGEHETAIGTVSKNQQEIATAVAPIMKAFTEFSREDGGSPPGGNAVVPVKNGGNGGGKMDIMALLQNPLVQKMFLGGGEQVNPMQAIMGQVQMVTDLISNIDQIRSKGGGGVGGGSRDWNRRDFYEGIRWGAKMKMGDIPAEVMKEILREDDNEGPPRVIVIEQPAGVKNRRERSSHSDHFIE